MLSRHYAAQGRFTFTSHDAGEHTICIGTNSTRWFGGNKLVSGSEENSLPATRVYMCMSMQRVHLDMSIGEHAVDYAQIAAKEKLNELQLRIRQLLDQIEQITKEQAYQRVSTIFKC